MQTIHCNAAGEAGRRRSTPGLYIELPAELSRPRVRLSESLNRLALGRNMENITQQTGTR
jgi:hypothetical protein